jgi:hypothetical protein
MDRLAAVAILSIEAPSFVAFLSFARGVGRLIEGKPHWFKAAIYAVYLSFDLKLRLNSKFVVIMYFRLTLLPFIIGLTMGCFGPAFILGFLASMGVTAVFAMLVLGRKYAKY